jgi:hypothetical protein
MELIGPMMRSYVGYLVMIIASTLAFTATVPAQQEFASYGVGNLSCASFLGSVKRTEPGHVTSLSRWGDDEKYFGKDGLYHEWIGGFLTATNKGSDASHQITVDYPGVDLWLRNWCQAHPADALQ